jgi:hypothetical protein
MVKRLVLSLAAAASVASAPAAGHARSGAGFVVPAAASDGAAPSTEPVYRRIDVVFSNHLDVGYTDFAHNVIQKYFYTFFPRAIETAATLAAEGVGYRWMTQCYLVDLFLNCPPGMEFRCPTKKEQELVADAVKK